MATLTEGGAITEGAATMPYADAISGHLQGITRAEAGGISLPKDTAGSSANNKMKRWDGATWVAVEGVNVA